MSKAPETMYERLKARVAYLEKRLELLGTDGNGNRVRVPEGFDGIACRDETIRNMQCMLDTLHGRPFSERAYTALHSRMQNAEALAGAAQCRVSHYESTLKYIQRNASVMTAHQIETMARDALTKEG